MIITATALACDTYMEATQERTTGNLGGSLFALALFFGMDYLLVATLAGGL